ncbi:MAG: UDP-N-acetylmuramoyl-L-alanyl-D-glutamate--2,6-diaminopimelate ligase [Agathobacter sp.]
MKLNELISNIKCEHISGETDIEIKAVAYDSRKVSEGSLFVCIRGYQSDGHNYIQNAIENGATALIVENVPDFPVKITVIQVSDAREALAHISAKWFQHPLNKMTIIGLTGTKGKTTTSHMIKEILEEAGKKVGMIGTIGAFIGEEKIPTKNTTPESYELQYLFDMMSKEGCQFVVMEVSSQGLKQKRTAGITFDYGAFLNISPDHIGAGEHADFEEYLECKKMLFQQTQNTIINIDAMHWQEVTSGARNPFTISTRTDADLMANNIKNVWGQGVLGVLFQLSGKLQGDVTLNIPGEFNVENALVALAITSLIGIEKETIFSALKKVSVKGRTQVLQQVSHFTTFVIDYAHNALSMEALLSTLKAYHPKRLICLFGGGGNKPRQRRYDMGEIAGKYADLTIITMDNPRYESMDEINKDIIRGLDVHHGLYQIILDRQEAIEYLIDNSGKDDIVVLIGKGHEEYQEVKGVKYYFSEEEIINNYLETK